MFADFCPSRMLSGLYCQRSINSFGTRQNPILSTNLTKDRLDPEPGRTPRACGIRLSQDRQLNRLRYFVNKNRKFLLLFSWDHRPLACWFRLPTETHFWLILPSDMKGWSPVNFIGQIFLPRISGWSQADDSRMRVSPCPL
jgi:hypothetical protein